jgi:aminoglycoside phosphotransferase (APT) family kinase protein
MIMTAGTVAATLHTSGITLGPIRTLDDELAGLSEKINLIQQTEPAFAAPAQAWLEQITAAAGRSSPLPTCLNHGDFKYAQLLFDGTTTGLVDFDAVCQAEPALDLGQFRAYLRTQIHKEQTQTTPTGLGEKVCAQFIRAYASAAGYRSEDEQRLHARVDIYEAISLLRMALNSKQKLKDNRLKNTMALLEARLGGAAPARPT